MQISINSQLIICDRIQFFLQNTIKKPCVFINLDMAKNDMVESIIANCYINNLQINNSIISQNIIIHNGYYDNTTKQYILYGEEQ